MSQESCCRHYGYGKESTFFLYLLSDHIGVVTCLDFEGAVVRPEVDGIGDAGDASLVDHLCRLRPRDRELQVGIFLPVSE